MPYRLRVTQEEVRQELANMGFKGLSDGTVAAMHKDLLKMIKSDLRKMKHERQDGQNRDISDPCSSVTTNQHSHHKGPRRRSQPSLLSPRMMYTKEKSLSSLSASHTSEEKNESTEESGYSDVESTTSDVSDMVYTYSGAVEIPQRQTSTEVKHTKLKEAATKNLMKHTKQPISTTHKECGETSYMETIVPAEKTTGKTKTKQVGKKGLPQYPSRPDPVRLYHYYKAHWDQYKVPGEDPRLKLRWDVRSKLFYGE